MSFNVIKTKVLVLSGKCPAILAGGSYEDVKEWITAIDRFKKPDEDYQVSVYRYWARQQLRDDQELLEAALRSIAVVKNSGDTIYSLATKLSQ